MQLNNTTNIASSFSDEDIFAVQDSINGTYTWAKLSAQDARQLLKPVNELARFNNISNPSFDGFSTNGQYAGLWLDYYYNYNGVGGNTFSTKDGILSLDVLSKEQANISQLNITIPSKSAKAKFTIDYYLPTIPANWVLIIQLLGTCSDGSVYVINSTIAQIPNTTGWHQASVNANNLFANIPIGKTLSTLRVDIRFRLSGMKIKNPTLLFEEYNEKPLAGAKLITLGDSITEGITWQPTVAKITGATWSQTETQSGVNGFAKMGQGASKVRPIPRFWTQSDPENYKNGLAFDTSDNPIYEADGVTQKYWFYGNNPTDSLYIRARDIVHYNPTHIVIMGGQNDGLQPLGDLSDTAYTGEWLMPDDPNLPSFVSCYKGMLERIITDNPTAKIYLCTTMYNGQTSLSTSQLENYRLHRNLIQGLADYYACTFVDTMTGSGISPYNSSQFYSDTVHPNAAGGERLGRFIASKLY